MGRVQRHVSVVAVVAVVAVVTAYLCAAAGLVAQTPPGAGIGKHRDVSALLRVITPIVRDDPHRAVRMLGALDKEFPGNPEVLGLLGETYGVLGEVDSAIAAYGRCLDVNPADIRVGASLGMLHIQKGDRDKGESVFRSLISRTGRSVNTYRTIGMTLGAGGFHDLALRMFEEGRRENKVNYILTLDIAQLHRTMGDFEASLGDYLYLVETSPKHYALARDRILELFRDPRVEGTALLDRLAAAARASGEGTTAQSPHPAAQGSPQRANLVDLLALVYLERGMIENALETALEAEKLGDPDGKVLFNLAEKTALEYERQPFENRAKYFDMALRATEAFIDGHPKAPQVPRAKLMLVDLLTGLASGRVERLPAVELETATTKAIETLDWMIKTFPGSDHAEAAYLKKGDLVFRVQKRPREAIAIYQEGFSKARFHPAAFAERLGRLYLVVGDYDNAGAYFTRLVNDREPELHETGIYYVGLLLGITGQYEAARDTLSALAEGNPSSRFTNDAIGLAWAIEEGLQGDQKVLGRYVAALRHEAAEDTTEAIGALGEIAALPVETPLRSRALLELGELYQSSGVFEKAMEAFETFVRDYPTDIRVPDAHRHIGQVYEFGYGDAKLALETYEDILLSYPHYIFLDEVREDVTRLRNKAGVQDGSS